MDDWTIILIVAAWMAVLLIPACTVKDPRPRLMLMFGIFFLLSFGGMVEGFLELVEHFDLDRMCTADFDGC